MSTMATSSVPVEKTFTCGSLIYTRRGLITVVAFVFHYKVFRGWKRLGGEVSYVAPSADVEVFKLPPRAGDTGLVPKGLVLVAASSWIGGLLSLLTWFSYYTWWVHTPRYAAVFAIAIAVSVTLFSSYVRFVKFMERP